MVLFHVEDTPTAACADPVLLPIVDEAYRRPGGPAGAVMREQVCPGCPAGSLCLSNAMENGEWGIWGGTSPNERTRHGGATPKIRTRQVS